MRILMLIGRYRPRIGGTEIQAEHLAQELVKKGGSVTILTGRERGLARYEQHKGVNVQRLWIPDVGLSAFNALALGIGIYRFVFSKRNQFDVLHIHQALYPAFFGVLAARRAAKPSLVKIANSGTRFDLEVLSRQAGGMGKYAAQFLARNASSFIALNKQVAASLHSWGVSEQRVARIPNGVVVPGTPIQSHARLTYRKRLGLPADRPLIVCAASLQTKKNHSFLLEAWQQLIEQGHRATLILLGDGPLRPSLEQQVRERNLDQYVLFCGWVENVRDYLYAADLFVLPSLVEGLSNALLEAMSVGLPCVASDIPGNRELIQSSNNGLLFELGDVVRLTAIISELLLDRARAAQLGERARDSIMVSYSMSSIADQYIALYDTLL